MKHTFIVALLSTLGFLLPGMAGSSTMAQEPEVGVTDVEFVEWVTGPDSPNETHTRYNVYGTDLGSMFELNGTIYIAFGDTFGCCPPADGGAGGRSWRSNVIGYSTDHELEDGMTLDGMLPDIVGDARLVLWKSPEDVTLIPTYGIAVDDRIYLHYMAVQEWGEPGHWTLNRSGWAYSDDGGQRWTQPVDATWEGDTNFGQAALVERDGYLYVFGIHGGRYGGIELARVPADAVLQMDQYTYWGGNEWVKEMDSAVEIVPAPVGELSVAWNDYLERWIMFYLDEPQHGIVMRHAQELTGPWSDTTLVITSQHFPSLYGSYLHPWASDGAAIYFNMSQWGPYNVRLMRARLTRN